MKKTIISIAFVGIIAAGCDIDRQPYDKISSESMKTEANAITATYGNYALLKYSYIRWFEQLADFKSDDVLLNGKSVDTYFNIGTFTDSPSDNHVWGLWKQSYQVAYGTSAAISAIPDDTSSATLLHAKGENYFLRAYVHMNLIQIFANTWGLHKGSDPGVVIRTGPMMDTPVRSSVAEVLDFCEKDINRAISAMPLYRYMARTAWPWASVCSRTGALA